MVYDPHPMSRSGRWKGVLLAALLTVLGGCYGPQKLTRQLDDWVQEGYVRRPWLWGNTFAMVMIHVAQTVSNVLDGLMVNPVDFWGVSAWPFGRGTGTPFHHRLLGDVSER